MDARAFTAASLFGCAVPDAAVADLLALLCKFQTGLACLRIQYPRAILLHQLAPKLHAHHRRYIPHILIVYATFLLRLLHRRQGLIIRVTCMSIWAGITLVSIGGSGDLALNVASHGEVENRRANARHVCYSAPIEEDGCEGCEGLLPIGPDKGVACRLVGAE